MASFGRLPRLQSIGKSQRVDSEEPPPGQSAAADNDDIVISTSVPPVRQFCLNFEPEDANDAARALGETFRVLNPGAHICMRNRTYGASFSHCRRSIALAKTYSELRRLLEGRARVRLIRDYTSRIHAISIFVDEIQGLVEQEYSTWQTVCQSEVSRLQSTNLEYLSVVCEDLRIHINHWNSVKQRLHTDNWLRSQLPHLCHELEFVRATLMKLRDKAMFWADKLVRIGLKVFAHLDVQAMSPECLWCITRGVEEYNSIVAFIRTSNSQSLYETMSLRSTAATCPADLTTENWHACRSNNPTVSVDSTQIVSFSKILTTIADERSKAASYITRDFFLSSEEFIDTLQKWRLQTTFTWCSDSDECEHRVKSDWEYRSEAGSQASLSLSMLKLGDILVPDLSCHNSPLLGFISKERDFAEAFLSAVCQCTNLLRRTTGALKKQNTLLDKCSPAVEQKNSDDKNKRKSVSWGDTMDTNVKVQLLSRYMDNLWRSFGDYLFDYVYQHVWGSVCLQERQLGHIHHCPTQVVLMVAQMMKFTTAKDLFPTGSVAPILGVSDRLVALAAVSAWDNAFSAALAQSGVEKFHAAPLTRRSIDAPSPLDAPHTAPAPCRLLAGRLDAAPASGPVHCTKTALLFRDCFAPLYSVCAAVVNARRLDRDDQHDAAELSALHECLSRALVTSQRVLSWCTVQAHQLLAAWSVAAFLLVAQSDAKILGDEITHILQLTQALCGAEAPASAHYHDRIHQLWSQIHSVNAQMQSLSGCIMRQFGLDISRVSAEYFERCMPTGKSWKLKSHQDFPSEPNEYVYKALGQILEPVLNGCGPLKPTAQLGVISLAVTKMCEAWTGFILREKIRFSLHGAYQLQVDFDYVRMWLDSYIENEEVKQSILALEVLKYVTGVISLLKRQPPRNSVKPRDDKGAEYHTSPASEPSSGGSSSQGSPTLAAAGGSQYDTASGSDHDSVDAAAASAASTTNAVCGQQQIPNADDWLALRVSGGSRNWKITTCFNP